MERIKEDSGLASTLFKWKSLNERERKPRTRKGFRNHDLGKFIHSRFFSFIFIYGFFCSKSLNKNIETRGFFGTDLPNYISPMSKRAFDITEFPDFFDVGFPVSKRGLAFGPGFSDFFSSDFPASKRGLVFGPGFSDFTSSIMPVSKRELLGLPSASIPRSEETEESDEKRGIEDLISGLAPTKGGNNKAVKPKIRVYRRSQEWFLNTT